MEKRTATFVPKAYPMLGSCSEVKPADQDEGHHDGRKHVVTQGQVSAKSSWKNAFSCLPASLFNTCVTLLVNIPPSDPAMSHQSPH